MTCEIMLTVAMGKRLIARGLMADGQVQDAMRNHKLLIIGGSSLRYNFTAMQIFLDGQQYLIRVYRIYKVVGNVVSNSLVHDILLLAFGDHYHRSLRGDLLYAL